MGLGLGLCFSIVKVLDLYVCLDIIIIFLGLELYISIEIGSLGLGIVKVLCLDLGIDIGLSLGLGIVKSLDLDIDIVLGLNLSIGLGVSFGLDIGLSLDLCLSLSLGLDNLTCFHTIQMSIRNTVKTFTKELRWRKNDRTQWSFFYSVLYNKSNSSFVKAQVSAAVRNCRHTDFNPNQIATLISTAKENHAQIILIDYDSKRVLINHELLDDTPSTHIHFNPQTLLYERIQRPDLYFTSHDCYFCQKHFYDQANLKRHKQICMAKKYYDESGAPLDELPQIGIQLQYKTGIWSPRKTTFCHLRSCGLAVDAELERRLSKKLFVCWDTESYSFMLDRDDELNSSQVTFLAEQNTAFIIVADNILPGQNNEYNYTYFYPRSENDTDWMCDFVEHLLYLQRTMTEHYEYEARDIFEWLHQNASDAYAKGYNGWCEKIEAAEKNLRRYYSQLPIYAFNANYDLSVGRATGLVAALDQLDGPVSSLKKGLQLKLIMISKKYSKFISLIL